MKIILSRKGFDSKNGGIPSPILSDGKMISLPIRSNHNKTRLCDLNLYGVNLGELASALTSRRKQDKRISATQTVHLDPDIYAGFHVGDSAWHAAFGQCGPAQSHLTNNYVSTGDVFLFFGWFRQLRAVRERPRFETRSPHLHVIYGWLQVGEIWTMDQDRDKLLSIHPELVMHPHVADCDKYRGAKNTLYVASRYLSLQGIEPMSVPGAGAFVHYDEALRLTARDCPNRSTWEMPAAFMPRNGRSMITRLKAEDWSRHGDYARVSSGGYGQEFVLDTKQCPEAEQWLIKLMGHAGY